MNYILRLSEVNLLSNYKKIKLDIVSSGEQK
jgi:hypothetical protein